MKKINRKHISELLKIVNEGSFFKLIALEVCEIDIGYARVEMLLDERHMNTFGGIHGGVYASVIDTAAFWSVYCDLPEDVGCVSLDLQVHDLAYVKTGKIIAEGKRIKAGRTICLADVKLTHESGKIIAAGTSKLLVTKDLQSVSALASNLGIAQMPSKFI